MDLNLGMIIGLAFALYLLITVPKKKYEKKLLKANRKLNGLINRIDSYENQEDIDQEIVAELKSLSESEFGITELAERKINILMSKFM